MRPAGEARFGIVALLALQLLTSIAGVGLLARMSPAVDRILRENVYSTEAVEHMLAAVALGDADDYEEALGRAKSNITESEEQALLGALERDGGAALSGDAATRRQVVADLRELGEVNRQSMRRADERARLLGLAGAWAMALLGFAGFVVSLGVYRRVEAKLIRPVTEIDAVLAEARAGDGLRRCTRTSESPRQDRLAENLNWLLDRQRAPHARDSGDGWMRPLLLEFLDRTPWPTWVLDEAGGTLAANRAALDLPDASPWAGPPVGLDGPAPEGWRNTPVGSMRLIEDRRGTTDPVATG